MALRVAAVNAIVFITFSSGIAITGIACKVACHYKIAKGMSISYGTQGIEHAMIRCHELHATAESFVFLP